MAGGQPVGAALGLTSIAVLRCATLGDAGEAVGLAVGMLLGPAVAGLAPQAIFGQRSAA